MQRGRRARLDRLTRLAGEEDSAAVRRYHLLSTRAAIGEVVRQSLMRHGIDPSRAAALGVADEAAAELARLGDPPPLPSAEHVPGADAARRRDLPGDPLAQLDERMNRLVRHYRGGAEAPDLAQASLAELLAWSIAVGDSAGST